MIDIHSHILSGVDDGAGDLEASIAIAKIYAEAGYRQVVATPHADVDSFPFENYAQTIRIMVNKLNMSLLENRLGLVVFPGMEVGLDPVLPEMLARGKVLTLVDRRYLLVETSFNRLPLNWWNIVFSLATVGTTVIFAHPERCAQVADNPNLLDQIVQAGAKIQVNWDSFLGAYGHRVAKVARKMARRGLIHCLATDSHDVTHRNAANVREIRFQLKGIIGEENLNRISVSNPARVIAGKSLIDMVPGEMPTAKRRPWFGFCGIRSPKDEVAKISIGATRRAGTIL